MEKRRVLVVDDEQDIILYLCTLLEDHGYSTLSASSAETALEMARTQRPDLITLDISMPEKSGVRFYRELREDETLAKIPVIMVTGIQKEFEGFIKSRKQVPSPEGYISKPIDEQEFLGVVERLLPRADV